MGFLLLWRTEGYSESRYASYTWRLIYLVYFCCNTLFYSYFFILYCSICFTTVVIKLPFCLMIILVFLAGGREFGFMVFFILVGVGGTVWAAEVGGGGVLNCRFCHECHDSFEWAVLAVLRFNISGFCFVVYWFLGFGGDTQHTRRRISWS